MNGLVLRCNFFASATFSASSAGFIGLRGRRLAIKLPSVATPFVAASSFTFIPPFANDLRGAIKSPFGKLFKAPAKLFVAAASRFAFAAFAAARAFAQEFFFHKCFIPATDWPANFPASLEEDLRTSTIPGLTLCACKSLFAAGRAATFSFLPIGCASVP